MFICFSISISVLFLCLGGRAMLSAYYILIILCIGIEHRHREQEQGCIIMCISIIILFLLY